METRLKAEEEQFSDFFLLYFALFRFSLSFC